MNIEQINVYIQERLRQEQLTLVTSVVAADRLDEAGLLKDSSSTHGLPLRRILRKGVIHNSWQDTHDHWHIDTME